MSPEEKELLNKAVNLAEENNSILRSMRRSQRYASFARAVYWIFVIGSAIGAFYLIQPYYDEAVKLYKGASTQFQNLKR